MLTDALIILLLAYLVTCCKRVCCTHTRNTVIAGTKSIDCIGKSLSCLGEAIPSSSKNDVLIILTLQMLKRCMVPPHIGLRQLQTNPTRLNCVQRLSLQGNKDTLSKRSQKLKIFISAIHLPSRRRFSHSHFRILAVNLLNFRDKHKHKNAGAEVKLG